MTKFSKRDDLGYDKVLGELRRWQRATQSTSSQQPHTGGPSSAATNTVTSLYGPISGESAVDAVHGDYNYTYNVSQPGKARKPSL